MPEFRQIDIDLHVHTLIEQRRTSFAQSHNDILKDVLSGASAVHQNAPQPVHEIFEKAEEERTGNARARGNCSIEFLGKRYSAHNLKSAYKLALIKLSEHVPDFLQRFSLETGRSRRYVARSPAELYMKSPHLAADHAHPLVDGWYFDSNLSREQIKKRVRVAARLAGMNYGSDIKILENLALI